MREFRKELIRRKELKQELEKKGKDNDLFSFRAQEAIEN